MEIFHNTYYWIALRIPGGRTGSIAEVADLLPDRVVPEAKEFHGGFIDNHSARVRRKFRREITALHDLHSECLHVIVVDAPVLDTYHVVLVGLHALRPISVITAICSVDGKKTRDSS